MPLEKNRIVKAHALLSEKVFLRPHYLKLVFGKCLGSFIVPLRRQHFPEKFLLSGKMFLRGGGERKGAQVFEFTLPPPPQPDTARDGPENIQCLLKEFSEVCNVT